MYYASPSDQFIQNQIKATQHSPCMWSAAVEGGAKFCTCEEERGENAIPIESGEEEDEDDDGGDIGLAFSLPFV